MKTNIQITLTSTQHYLLKNIGINRAAANTFSRATANLTQFDNP